MITDAMLDAALQAAYGAVFGRPIADWSKRAMVRALEAAERAAWLSIETAPRDGTRVLLHMPGGDGEDVGRSVAIGSFGLWQPGEWTWVMEGGDAWTGATLWRPLPEPPDTGDTT